MTCIVTATPTMAAAIAQLQSRTFAEAPWSAPEIQAFMRDPVSLARAALGADQQLQGFLLSRLIADEAEILSIAVTGPARGGGIGRLLVTAALFDIDAQGGRRVFLEVSDDNKAALALYAKLGFRCFGNRSRYYRRSDGGFADALMLSKTIDASLAEGIGAKFRPVSETKSEL